jgi:hypothetical protein
MRRGDGNYSSDDDLVRTHSEKLIQDLKLWEPTARAMVFDETCPQNHAA